MVLQNGEEVVQGQRVHESNLEDLTLGLAPPEGSLVIKIEICHTYLVTYFKHKVKAVA
jgi:hypothetical protein